MRQQKTSIHSINRRRSKIIKKSRESQDIADEADDKYFNLQPEEILREKQQWKMSENDQMVEGVEV